MPPSVSSTTVDPLGTVTSVHITGAAGPEGEDVPSPKSHTHLVGSRKLSSLNSTHKGAIPMRVLTENHALGGNTTVLRKLSRPTNVSPNGAVSIAPSIPINVSIAIKASLIAL